MIGWIAAVPLIAQRRVAQNLKSRVHEDIVNALLIGCTAHFKSAEGAQRPMRGCSGFDIAVIQSTGHRVVSWRSRGYVKIPADQDRLASGKVLEARNDQRRAVGAGHFTAMIKMRVEMEKFLIGLQVEQDDPIRDSGDGGIPALAAGDFRCFRRTGKSPSPTR